MSDDKVLKLIKQAARDKRTVLDLSGNELTSLPYEVFKLPNLTQLDFSHNELTSLPSEISELTNLTSLYLHDNQLTSLPSEISELTNLTSLYLSGNQLTSLPSEISELINLTSLDISSNELTSLPSEISELTNLTSLYLSGNQLTSLPSEISKLTILTSLDISENQLTSLPSEISKLTNLTFLDLRKIQLTSLPSEIYALTNLTSLDISRNQLTSLPSEISKLTNLTKLLLYKNQLTSLPSEISVLINLTSLDISSNELTSLPYEVFKLPNLTQLDFSYNELTSLPSEIIDLDLEIEWDWKSWDDDGIFLKNNPLKTPPMEIVKKGRAAIIEYFKSLKGETQALNEVKVLLVGEGDSGKTSLVKQLLGEKFDENELQTHGINIRKWNVKEGKEEIRVNFWDFGGQEIMHATHQFFLSKRSLYILVLDGRKEEKIEYWLKHIESFGGDSPILVILNKMDENPSFDVNRSSLQKKYKGIKGFHRISCQNGKGLKNFEKHLENELKSVELRKTEFAKSWLKIKNQLEGMTDNFISYSQYEKMCIKEKITDKSAQDTLVDFLNNLGVILHFKDFELLDTHVLEPKWITAAVYRIINSEKLVESKGVLKLKLLDEILKGKKKSDYSYPSDKYNYIIDLMKKFELCFEIDNKTILLPSLLEVSEPKFDFDYDNSLKFIIQYDFLPKSVMPRFIVKRHKDIKDDLRWKTGLVLEDKALHATAVVKADENDKKIFIYVNGEQKRDWFSIIRKTFREINDSFEKLEAKELVPLPDNDEIAIEYEELIGYEFGGRDEYYVGKLRKAYSVKDLLAGIENEEERKVGKEFKDKFDLNINQKVEVNQKQEVKQDVKIDIKIEMVSNIQSDFEKLKDILIKSNPEFEKKLNEIEDSLDEVSGDSEKEKLKKPMNKLNKFLKKLGDENSDYHKAISNTKKGIEIAKKLGNTYNKFAPFLALPIVPPLILGK